jgi:hypothetical protein
VAAVTITAFQKNAFQNNAFQIATKKKVGWGFRHTKEELEERFRQQRNQSLSRRWFDDFLEALEALSERAEKLTDKQRGIVQQAVAEASGALAEALEDGREVHLTPLLLAAAFATRVTAVLKHSRAVIDAARYDDEEEELIEMLLLH